VPFASRGCRACRSSGGWERRQVGRYDLLQPDTEAETLQSLFRIARLGGLVQIMGEAGPYRNRKVEEPGVPFTSYCTSGNPEV
jgi:hypothetical protein